MKKYPALEWIARHGRMLAPAVAAVFIAAGVYIYVRTGIPESIAAGAMLGIAGFGITRAATELIEVITEMLLPR